MTDGNMEAVAASEDASKSMMDDPRIWHIFGEKMVSLERHLHSEIMHGL